jgi:hypothetical protein
MPKFLADTHIQYYSTEMSAEDLHTFMDNIKQYVLHYLNNNKFDASHFAIKTDVSEENTDG